MKTRKQLTLAQIREIHKRFANGERRKVLAIEYGVSYSHLCNVLSGYKWNTFSASDKSLPVVD